MVYIAHIRGSDGQVQSVAEHLFGVRVLAETYGGKIGVKHIAGLAGMLHDMGKYTKAFQQYILEAIANPDAPPRKGSVDHSTAGGKLLYEWFHTGTPSPIQWALAEVTGNAIISHHSYLHDFLGPPPELKSDYLRRVRDTELDEYEQAKQLFFEQVIDEAAFRRYVDAAAGELQAYLAKPSPETAEGKLMFLTKFIFSALIDADRTNTRQFEENRPEPMERSREELFHDYYDKLMRRIDSFRARNPKEEAIHRLRRRMSDRCEAFSDKPSGIYTLSIPTGGGKTLASFRYALKHAMRHGKSRIIYVVPFTTIIEQNAEELRGIIQDDEHLLEHHSNIIVEDGEENDEHLEGRIGTAQKLKLAKDNWDAPIVMTTMVQFLNVFYAKGSRYIRRLHNLSEAVIIFDEAQKVPIPCISLFNRAVNFLNMYAQTSIVLCTATQPALDFVEHKLAISAEGEMVDNLAEVAQAFKRVETIDCIPDGAYTTERLAKFLGERLAEVRSALVILNTKSAVRRLYEHIKGQDAPLVYHLSTSMCPAHRSSTLEKVKAHLEREEPVVCISTQLIEAGVDVSFDCVIRSAAGLDSIAQAAGRCNRHGRNEMQKVYVIDHAEERLDKLKEIRVGKQLTAKILAELRRNAMSHGGHMLSIAAMQRYFQELYSVFKYDVNYPVRDLAGEKHLIGLLTGVRKSEETFHPAYKKCNQNQALPLVIVNSYRTAAEHFRVIENLTESVLVPYGERGKDIIARLNGNEAIEDVTKLLRKAQHYSVNLFRPERDRLAKNGGLVPLLDGMAFALKEGAYSEEFGVNLENDGAMEEAIF